TLEPLGLLPLLGGCAAAYLSASLLMKNSIMTEKIARRGIRPPVEYVSDPLEQILVHEIASSPVITLLASQSVGDVRRWLSQGGSASSHQGFPIFNDQQLLVGVLTRRNLLDPTVPEDKPIDELIRQPVKFVYHDCTVRQVAEHMVNHDLGRLPVVDRHTPGALVGIVTRSDVLAAYRRSIQETMADAPTITLGTAFTRSRS
ncbi:MAG TPA: CBS domain-containing protein, partial [Schlesneria sp.]